MDIANVDAGGSSRANALGQAAMALAGTGAMLAFHAASGFPSLADSGGDNDSVLRLVQVRDLLGGQGWFDPTQYRMGLGDGFPMHWSRLVDAPIALLVALFGETVALVIWPSLLFAASLYLIFRAARALGGQTAVLPGFILGGLSLYFVGVFRPGALDHHNVQLALTLAAVAFLIDGKRPAWAGICAAAMLAIGMEAAPYTATACVIAALYFLFNGTEGARFARRFGAGFSVTCAAVFVGTIAPQSYLAAACDAFSLPQALLGVLGGAGLAAIGSLPALRSRFAGRLLALVALGVVCIAVLVLGFPQCLGDPYADLHPRLKEFWLGSVVEAQSFADLLQDEPARLLSVYVTPVIGLFVLGRMALRTPEWREAMTLAAFLAMAFAVSIWQVRGSTFSVPLATIALAAWIGSARARAEREKTPKAQFAMALSWIVSANLVWQLIAMPFVSAEENAVAGETPSDCYAHADYVAMAALPPGTVAVISNLGSSVIANTPHQVLAGPYHRNQHGNLANLDLMMAKADEAVELAAKAGVDYVALCPGNPETDALVKWAPEGLVASLARSEVPARLTPVATGALLIWQVHVSDR